MSKSSPKQEALRKTIEAEYGPAYTLQPITNLHVIDRPKSKHEQYSFAHRVNDENYIESALAGGISGIECDIIWSSSRDCWVVQHDTPNLSHAGPTLVNWLEKLRSLLSTGKYDATFSVLWFDIKSPNDDSLSNMMKLVHDSGLPTRISIIYDLNEFSNVLGDPKSNGKGYNSIKSSLRSNEGIGVIFWGGEGDKLPTVSSKFASDDITRIVASHGHAINVSDSTLAKINELNNLCEDAYRFKKIFTWTIKLKKSMENFINPNKAHRTDGQMIGSPISEWKPKYSEDDIPDFKNAVTKFSSSQRLAIPADNFWVPTPQPSYYRIIVHTGNVSGAGTDSSIHLNIIGDKGSTGDLHLNGDRNNGSNWNKFERENTDIFHIYSVDLGSIEGATISSSGKCFCSDWYLSSISIENSYFSVNRWIKKGSYTFKENRLSKDYHIQVKTGDENGAGTDSDIYLTIHGEEGSTPEIRLNGYILGDAFERNDLDSLTLFGLPDVGTIKSVKLRSNGRWAASNWYLNWISINNEQVVVNQWIDGKTKNGPIELWNLEIKAVVKNSGNETSNPETVKNLQS